MKILVTGSNGLAGNAIRRVSKLSHHDFTFLTRKDCDLRIWGEVNPIIESVKPDAVIHTAARVGGIAGNEAMHADFLYDNLMINANVLKSCAINSVKKVLAFSSVCVFPDNLSSLEEDRMHEGPVFQSNFAYGYAKRMVDVHITALKKQYGIQNYCSVIPGNIFGSHDMFSIEYGHVIPSLIHKMYLAKKENKDFDVWGDGNSLREFLYIDDLADILLKLIELKQIPDRLIVSGRKQQSIREIVEILANISKFEGTIVWDETKPNGQRSRPTSKALFDRLFPNFKYTSVYDGLEETWRWFIENYSHVRTQY